MTAYDSFPNAEKYFQYLKIAYNMRRQLSNAEKIFLFGPEDIRESLPADMNLSEFMNFANRTKYIPAAVPELADDRAELKTTRIRSSKYGELHDVIDNAGRIIATESMFEPEYGVSKSDESPVNLDGCCFVYAGLVYNFCTKRVSLLLATNSAHFCEIGQLEIVVETGEKNFLDRSGSGPPTVVMKDARGAFRILRSMGKSVAADCRKLSDAGVRELCSYIMGSVAATSTQEYKIVTTAPLDLRTLVPRKCLFSSARQANELTCVSPRVFKKIDDFDMESDHWCVSHRTGQAVIFRHLFEPLIVASLPETPEPLIRRAVVAHDEYSVIRDEWIEADLTRVTVKRPGKPTLIMERDSGEPLPFRPGSATIYDDYRSSSRRHESSDPLRVFSGASSPSNRLLCLHLDKRLGSMPRPASFRHYMMLWQTMRTAQGFRRGDFVIDTDRPNHVAAAYMLMKPDDSDTDTNRFAVIVRYRGELRQRFALQEKVFTAKDWSRSEETMLPERGLKANLAGGRRGRDDDDDDDEEELRSYYDATMILPLRVTRNRPLVPLKASGPIAKSVLLTVSDGGGDKERWLQLLRRTQLMASDSELVVRDEGFDNFIHYPVLLMKPDDLAAFREATHSDPLSAELSRNPSRIYDPDASAAVCGQFIRFEFSPTETRLEPCEFHMNNSRAFDETESPKWEVMKNKSNRERAMIFKGSGSFFDLSLLKAIKSAVSGVNVKNSKSEVSARALTAARSTVRVSEGSHPLTDLYKPLVSLQKPAVNSLYARDDLETTQSLANFNAMIEADVFRLNLVRAKPDPVYALRSNRPGTKQIYATQYDESAVVGWAVDVLSGKGTPNPQTHGVDAGKSLTAFYCAVHPSHEDLQVGQVILDYEFTVHGGGAKHPAFSLLTYVTNTVDVTSLGPECVGIYRHKGASAWYHTYDAVAVKNVNLVAAILCAEEPALSPLLTRAKIPMALTDEEFRHNGFPEETEDLLHESYARIFGPVFVFEEVSEFSVRTSLGRWRAMRLAKVLDGRRCCRRGKFADVKIDGTRVVVVSDSPLFALRKKGAMFQKLTLPAVVAQDSRFRTNAEIMADGTAFLWPELTSENSPLPECTKRAVSEFFKVRGGQRDVTAPVFLRSGNGILSVEASRRHARVTAPDFSESFTVKIVSSPLAAQIGSGGLEFIYGTSTGVDTVETIKLTKEKAVTFKAAAPSDAFALFTERIVTNEAETHWSRGLMVVKNRNIAEAPVAYPESAGAVIVPLDRDLIETIEDSENDSLDRRVIACESYEYFVPRICGTVLQYRDSYIVCHRPGFYVLLQRMLSALAVIGSSAPRSVAVYAPDCGQTWMAVSESKVEILKPSDSFLGLSAVGSDSFKEKMYGVSGVTETRRPLMYVHETVGTYAAAVGRGPFLRAAADGDTVKRHFLYGPTAAGDEAEDVPRDQILTLTTGNELVEVAKKRGLVRNVVGPDAWRRNPWDYDRELSKAPNSHSGQRFCALFDRNRMPEYLTGSKIRKLVRERDKSNNALLSRPTGGVPNMIDPKLPTPDEAFKRMGIKRRFFEWPNDLDTENTNFFLRHPKDVKYTAGYRESYTTAKVPFTSAGDVDSPVKIGCIRVEFAVDLNKAEGVVIEPLSPFDLPEREIEPDGTVVRRVDYGRVTPLWQQLMALTRCGGLHPVIKYEGQPEVVTAVKLLALRKRRFGNECPVTYNRVKILCADATDMVDFVNLLQKSIVFRDNVIYEFVRGGGSDRHPSLDKPVNFDTYNPARLAIDDPLGTYAISALQPLYDHLITRAPQLLKRPELSAPPALGINKTWLGLLNYLHLAGFRHHSDKELYMRDVALQQIHNQNWIAARAIGEKY